MPSYSTSRAASCLELQNPWKLRDLISYFDFGSDFSLSSMLSKYSTTIQLWSTMKEEDLTAEKAAFMLRQEEQRQKQEQELSGTDSRSQNRAYKATPRAQKKGNSSSHSNPHSSSHSDQNSDQNNQRRKGRNPTKGGVPLLFLRPQRLP